MYQEHKNIVGVPILLVGQGPPYRGTVLVYHGLGSNKETQTKELTQLAQRGFLAVGVDAVGHGERRFSDFESRMNSQASHLEFLSMVRDTANEVPRLVQALSEACGELGPFGITGISMGGCITFAAACNFHRLVAAVPILGTPDWSLDGRHELPPEWWQDSPHHTPEWFNPTALLVQNAGRDVNVPPGPARDFVKEARLYYSDFPQRLAYVEYPESEHFMREADWAELWDRTLGWFERFLVTKIE